MFKALRYIFGKIVKQGNGFQEEKIMAELWAAHRRTYTEDNIPTIRAYLIAQLDKAISNENP